MLYGVYGLGDKLQLRAESHEGRDAACEPSSSAERGSRTQVGAMLA